jgi:hypothetical protein
VVAEREPFTPVEEKIELFKKPLEMGNQHRPFLKTIDHQQRSS